MNQRQRTAVDQLRVLLTALTSPNAQPGPRARLVEFLTQVNAAWFADHAADPNGYIQELAQWNQVAGWTNTPAAQVTHWNHHLLTPKFFGGAIIKLDDDYVLGLSLNHKAIKDAIDHAFLDEVNDTQTEAQRIAHCLQYFQRPYAYRNFFGRGARGKMLAAYRAALRRTPPWPPPTCTTHTDPPPCWRCLNEETGLYIEAYPTWSVESHPPAGNLPLPTTFLAHLNRLVHEAVLTILPPRALLAAGKDAHSALDLAVAAGVLTLLIPWQDITALVLSSPRTNAGQRRVLITTTIAQTSRGKDVRVVRCGFLNRLHGPKHAELIELGSALAT